MTTTKSTSKSKKNGQVSVGINVQIPTPLHRQLRMKGVAKGLTLTEAVNQAVQAWVKAR